MRTLVIGALLAGAFALAALVSFFWTPWDVAALERSIALAREVAATRAVKPFVVREVAPGRDLKGEELANFVRDGATTYFHSSGACRQ